MRVKHVEREYLLRIANEQGLNHERITADFDFVMRSDG
jgi:hypothetical protein